MKVQKENSDKIISALMQESICAPSRDVATQVFKQIELQKMSQGIITKDNLIKALGNSTLIYYVVIVVILGVALAFNTKKIVSQIFPLSEINLLLSILGAVALFVFVVSQLDNILRYKRQCSKYKIDGKLF